ncbi:hypothetical protein MTO96_044535 [Rhipicephalus appendiculatus]
MTLEESSRSDVLKPQHSHKSTRAPEDRSFHTTLLTVHLLQQRRAPVAGVLLSSWRTGATRRFFPAPYNGRANIHPSEPPSVTFRHALKPGTLSPYPFRKAILTTNTPSQGSSKTAQRVSNRSKMTKRAQFESALGAARSGGGTN